MGIIIERDELLRGLATAPPGITDQLGSHHAWARFLMGEDEALRIVQSDSETTIACPVEAICDDVPDFCLPAQSLARLVKLLDGEISITLDGSRAVVEAGASSYRLPWRESADFSPIPAMKCSADHFAEIRASIFRHMVEATLYAVDKYGTEAHALRFLLVRAGGGELLLVGCDSKRLSVARAPGVDPVVEFEVLVPPRVIQTIAKYSTGKGVLRLWADENHCMVGTADGNDGTVWTRISAEQYPAWEQIEKIALPNSMTLPVATLQAAVSRASLLGEERTGVTAIQLWTFGPDEGRLKIEASDVQRGDANEIVMTLEPSRGSEGACVGVSGAQVLDFLDRTKAGRVVVEYRDEGSPVRLRPDAAGAFEWSYTAMPVRYAPNPPAPEEPSHQRQSKGKSSKKEGAE